MKFRYKSKDNEYFSDKISGVQDKIFQSKDVSVILPTYNEEENISDLLKEISAQLNAYDFEIIVVDDNSKDKTPSIIDTLAAKDEKIVAFHRFGKGNIFTAIRDGVKVSRGKNIVTMDADFSHPPKKITELLMHLDKYDLVSGSRYIKGGKVNAPLIRTQYASQILNIILRFTLGIRSTDITGGFHAIPKSKFELIHFKYPSVWGEFDLELFYRAKQLKFKVKEVPFTYKYRDKGQSKSKTLLYVWIYFIRAIKLMIQG